MQNNTLSTVSWNFKKLRISDLEQNHNQQPEREQSALLRKIEQEQQHEKKFNDARMKVQYQHESEDLISKHQCQSYNKYPRVQTKAQGLKSKKQFAGISTSPKTISLYINGLISYFVEKYGEQILDRINSPYGISCLKRMRSIREEDEYLQDEEEPEIQSVLDLQLYIEYEQFRLQRQKVNYELKDYEHLHNKAIFDACNEALDQSRPYFKNDGIPYSWDNQISSLKILDFQKHMKNMTYRVLNWSKIFCGFLPIEKQEVTTEKQQIIDAKHQIRIQRLSKDVEIDLSLIDQSFDCLYELGNDRQREMLLQEIKDYEYKWYQFQNHKTQFLMQLADMIFRSLVEEVASDL